MSCLPFLAGRDRIEHQLVVEAAADDHRAPVEEALGEGGPAPHQDAVPLEPGLIGIELPPHRRMDAVAADENVAGHCGARALGEFLEAGFDGSFLLREGGEYVARVHGRAPQPLDHGIAQHALQVAAVDGKLRHFVAGLQAARLAPDFLAEAVGVDQLARADGDLVEPRQQPELGQLGNGMRQHVDADPKLADFRRRLVDVAGDAARMQHQPEREPTDTAPNNNDVHRTFPNSGKDVAIESKHGAVLVLMDLQSANAPPRPGWCCRWLLRRAPSGHR